MNEVTRRRLTREFWNDEKECYRRLESCQQVPTLIRSNMTDLTITTSYAGTSLFILTAVQKKKDIVITLYKSNNIKRLRSFERAVYPSEDLLMIYTSICLPNHPPVISRDSFDDHIAMVAAQQIPVEYKLGFEKFVKLSTVNPHIKHKRDFFTSSVEVHHIRVCNKMWCIKAEK